MKISEFKDIARNYKLILFDAYGVLKNAQGVFPYVKEMFAFLRKQNIKFYILTNDASLTPKEIAHSYKTGGLNFISEEKIISSGMVTKNYLRQHYKPGDTVSYFGVKSCANYYRDLGLNLKHINQINAKNEAEIKAFLFLDHQDFKWETDINKVINLFGLHQPEGIVANSDLSYPISEKEMSIAIGGIAEMIENITEQEFLKFGKPNQAMYSLAYAEINKNYAFAKKDILMVGDTLTTDIVGGKKFGIDTCLTLAGAAKRENFSQLIAKNKIKPDFVVENISVKKTK